MGKTWDIFDILWTHWGYFAYLWTPGGIFSPLHTHNGTYDFKPPHLECTDLYETFRDTVKWSNKMIQDVFLDTFFIVLD